MSRQPREVSSTGFYHVIFRGVNHCHLFEESEDYAKMMGLLSDAKEEMGMELHAYCFMSNHVHLLVREKAQKDVALAMRKVLGSYASWFNKKYGRSGALIANRYKSKGVEDDPYLLTVVRYIHHNPVSAGVVRNMNDYSWSSYRDYVSGNPRFTDTDFVLSIFHTGQKTAVDRFIEFHAMPVTEDFSEPEVMTRSESQIHDEIVHALGDIELHAVPSLPKAERDALLVSLRNRGLSIRQIERVTGISRGVISRAR